MDDYDELTLRDVDPAYVRECEDRDHAEEKAHEPGSGLDATEAATAGPGAEDDDPCDTCENEREDCGNCDGSGEDMYGGTDDGCYECGGTGERIPDHCCACGGSPYCQCCSKCGSPCVGDCRCPIPVQMSDGTTRTV